MKFSPSTLTLLKSFSSINPGIHFRKGNVLTTYHPNRVILAQAKLEDTIPQDFTIYSLSTFIAAISLCKDPELVFKKDKVILTRGGMSINYLFADQSSVKPLPPEGEINMGEPDVAFEISEETLEDLKKAATVMELGDLKIEGNGERVKLVAYNSKDPLTNTFVVDTEVQISREFTAHFCFPNLEILPGSYSIGIKFSKGAGNFQNKKYPVQYWIALEKDSKG